MIELIIMYTITIGMTILPLVLISVSLHYDTKKLQAIIKVREPELNIEGWR